MTAESAERPDPELLAYCGLYCGDCAGHSTEIAERASELVDALDRFRFDRTAATLFRDRLPDYAAFTRALGFIAGLRCPAPCRARSDDSAACRIHTCCRSKGLSACHECGGFETCATLSSLRDDLHGDACLMNLRAIREMGLTAWLSHGTRRWFGDDASTPSGRAPGP